MPDKTVAQKLHIKENYKVVFINEPDSYRAILGELPQKVSVLNELDKSADIIQWFVSSKKELLEELNKIKSKLGPKGTLCVTYPKGTSGIKTDVNRDIIREYAQSIGLKSVAMISVDDTWSALRLKLSE